MLTSLSKEQVDFQIVKRDEWVNLSLHEQSFDEAGIISGVKWLYTLSGLKEPQIIICSGPKDVAEKLRTSVRDSVGASVGDSVRASVRDSVRDSVWASVRDSVRASVRASVGDSVRASVWDSVRDSVWASVRDSVRASVGASLLYASEYGAWYEYWRDLKIISSQENAEKYMKFLRSGPFCTFLFEKVVYVMLRPTVVKQDTQKRLHSEIGPALSFKDATEIYKLQGVTFEKEWRDKIVNDDLAPDEIFAIDNIEHRRIAYEYMDKLKMKQLPNYVVLDDRVDEKGNNMKIVSFTVQNMETPLKFYNCFCPSTKREYFIGTDYNTCKEAKAQSFGLSSTDVTFIDEW